MTALPADVPYDRILSPAVLLFGDDVDRRRLLEGRIIDAGGRVVANGSVAEAIDRLAMQAAFTGLVIDVREDHGAPLDGLLARADAIASGAGRPFVLVLAPHALIDTVVARISDPEVALLVDPSPEEVDAVLAGLMAPQRAVAACGTVADGVEANNRRLAQLSEEVGRIARTLAALSTDEAVKASGVVRGPSPADAALVRSLLRLRRLRAQHFLPELFADPAWDMLLDLAAARIEGRRVAVSSLCIAAAVPATTALRWITQMTDQHLFERRADPSDGRRVFIGLSEAAAGAMDAYLGAAHRIVAPAG